MLNSKKFPSAQIMSFYLAASQLKFPFHVQNIFHQSKNNVVLACIFYVGEHGAAIFILKNEKEISILKPIMKIFLNLSKLKPVIKRVQNF